MWYEYLLLLGSMGIIVFFGVPTIWERYSRFKIQRICKDTSIICITFDDGPSERLTESLLKIFNDNKVKGTFFVLGKKIRGREYLVKKIAEQGHDICSHGYGHRHPWKISPWREIADIKKSNRYIRKILGSDFTFTHYRPPYGKLNIVTLIFLMLENISLVPWTLDSRDTWKNMGTSLNFIKRKLKQGGVLLLHDFTRDDPEKEKYVINSVRAALTVAKQRGLAVTAFSSLEKEKKYETINTGCFVRRRSLGTTASS